MDRFAWTTENAEMARRMWLDGYSSGQIAGILGCTRSAAIGKISRMGLKRSGPNNTLSISSKRAARSRKPKAHPVTKTGGLPLRIPPPLPDLPEPPRSNSLLSFHELESHHCRFPLGDPRSSDFGFCGRPSEPGKAYCADHCCEAYQNRKRLAPTEPETMDEAA